MAPFSRTRLLVRCKNGIIYVCQIITYVIGAPILPRLARAQLWTSADLATVSRGFLIIANHQSFLDPFIVLGHIPFRIFLKMLPIRFPVHHKFMVQWKWAWLRLVGSYDIGGTPREKMIGLYRTRALLHSGTTIFLFPEGKIQRDNQIGELQKGIHFLLAGTTKIMTVRLRGFHRRDMGMLWEKRSIIFKVVPPNSSAGSASEQAIRQLYQSTS